MNKSTLLFTFFALSLAGLCFASGSRSGDDFQPMMPVMGLEPALEAPTDSLNDSIREAMRVERLVSNADETYKKLRNMRFEGFDEPDYYPVLYACYEANVAAIDSLPGHPRVDASKAVLLDIYKDLLDGAYFYSSAKKPELLTKFAQAYLDLQAMPVMEGETFARDERSFPTIAYIAASGAYNDKDFPRAIRYFDTFLSTGSDQQRENVYMYLGQACLFAKEYDHGVTSMAEAMVLYPANYNVITLGLQCCIDGKRAEMIQHFLDKALILKPGDEQLLNIQGQVYEDQQDYKKALDVYNQLNNMRPNNLSITKHLALNYFNLGVHYYNSAIMQEDEKTAKRNKRQSNSYFEEAARKLEEILANDPLAVKYMKALAVTYGCTDQKEKFDEINNRIRALGQQPEKSVMPSMIAFNEDNSTNFSSKVGRTVAAGDVPPFSEFGKSFVTDGLAKWAQRGQFEKTEEYAARVSDANAQAEYQRLCVAAEEDYIRQYGRSLRINDMKLAQYDPDNESYLIQSDYGDIVLKVPMKNREAEIFSSSWDKVQLRAPRFYIKNDRSQIASITFQTPAGKSYAFNAEDAATYAYTDVQVDFGSIIDNTKGSNLTADNSARKGNVKKVTLQSDVDKNIPIVRKPNDNTVALIVANENYRNVSNVSSAIHDGEVFAEYCQKTLGIPASRIKHYSDASLATFLEALADAKHTVKAMGDNVNLIVYYAGHGMPDEATKDAYLIPVDGNATIAETCFSLNRLYKELENMNAASTMVFLDACFSGAQRGDGMLVAARGVAIKPKAATPQGNMYVLSAASGQETAMPYREKNHGIFTYYLLKKLQETKGDVTLKELTDYVTRQVKEQSNNINKKPQNPQVTLSGNMNSMWNSLKLR